MLTYAELVVVGEAKDVPAAERLVQELRPDLAVVDVMLPGINDLHGASRLKARQPDLRVILVSAHRDRAGVLRTAAAQVGAEIFISKDDLELDVVRAWSHTAGDYK